MDAANCASVKSDGFLYKLKGWFQAEEVEAVVSETTAVSPSPPLELPKQETAVPDMITIDSLEAIHEQLFTIFYDADARRMMIADDPVLAQLELPRRWPNMECCIAGQHATEMFYARVDICVSHIDLLEIGDSPDTIHILLTPDSMAEQVIETNKHFSRRLILIRY